MSPTIDTPLSEANRGPQTPVHKSTDEWIKTDAIPFSLDSPASIDAGVDRIVGMLGGSVELLGFGEALHGSEEILLIRNRLFQQLVAAHGYSAVVIEVTSPQARAINEYVLGARESTDPAVQEWFSTGFGALDANRELIEWLREYNCRPPNSAQLHFYGFDIPLGQGSLASPSRVLDIVLDYLDRVDGEVARAHRERMSPLLGETRDWEKPEAWYDPSQSIGVSAQAAELRLATLDLITELRIRRPELTAKSEPLAFADALHHAELARKLLEAHAALAKPGAYATMLGVRDLIMADNLEHFLTLERGRGKVLVFSAAGHLTRGLIQWQLPPEPGVKEWWPAGSQVAQSLGSRYAAIAMALGVSEPNGIAEPEPGTVEARLMGAGEALFIPTHRDQGLPAAELEAAPVRSGSSLNPTYYTLTPRSFREFDALVFLASTSYPRGAQPLTSWNV
ncbi:MAG TPA: erythromycin esterase family protein [Candidatus Dormibacteraeota bacterium]|nr:erythromycin esterase family protein [Candidatus Dormibacteraeota bacterium]